MNGAANPEANLGMNQGTARLPESVLHDLDRRLEPVDARIKRTYRGQREGRQPVHTVYVPADRFTASLSTQWGSEATTALATHAATPAELATATGFDPTLVAEVHPRVLAKLDQEPIEDLRIDFEDGYGHRPDDAEDASVHAAAEQLVGALHAGTAPPYVGIRFKSLDEATRRRGVRTLDSFIGALTRAATLPTGFVLTLPKVTAVEQVEAMTDLCATLEDAHGLAEGRLRYEIQVETPQAIVAADGTAALAPMVHAAGDRLVGLHYGTYDYSAACGVAPAEQSMEHPAADHAKAVMQLAAAGTGVRLSDGATNVLPVGDTSTVRHAWHHHARLVTRSLQRAFYQGWDMHPAHLVTRYTATYAFFRSGLPEAGARLRAYAEQADAGMLDEPATAETLAAFLLRGLDCGAVDPAEVTRACGLDQSALHGFATRART